MSGLFSEKTKLRLHIAELVLIVVAIGLTLYRMFSPGPKSRNTMMALGMGVKSIIIISYQLLTEHVRRLHRWASLKANTILNGLEILFWGAVAFMSLQANLQVCTGTSCTVGWIIVVVAIFIVFLTIWVFIISWKEFRFFRRHGAPLGATVLEDRGHSMEHILEYGGANQVQKERSVRAEHRQQIREPGQDYANQKSRPQYQEGQLREDYPGPRSGQHHQGSRQAEGYTGSRPQQEQYFYER